MSLPVEIRQLTEHLFKAHEARMAAVAGIRVNTATEIAGFQEARQAMSVQQQQQLDQYLHLCGMDGCGRSLVCKSGAKGRE